MSNKNLQAERISNAVGGLRNDFIEGANIGRGRRMKSRKRVWQISSLAAAMLVAIGAAVVFHSFSFEPPKPPKPPTPTNTMSSTANTPTTTAPTAPPTSATTPMSSLPATSPTTTPATSPSTTPATPPATTPTTPATTSATTTPDDLTAGVIITAKENNDLRSAIIDEIRSGNNANKVSEMTEFYYPHVEIKGYILRHVAVWEGAYVYMYAPVGAAENLNIGIGSPEAIQIFITRPEYYYEHYGRSAQESFYETLYANFNDAILTEDDMIYFEKWGFLLALMADTQVQIRVPSHRNSYDYLRDLARQVIDTAELVKVR